MNNSTDSMFDLNHDGKLDSGEQYYEYKVLEDITKDSSDCNANKNGTIPTSFGSDDTVRQILIFFRMCSHFFYSSCLCRWFLRERLEVKNED